MLSKDTLQAIDNEIEVYRDMVASSKKDGFQEDVDKYVEILVNLCIDRGKNTSNASSYAFDMVSRLKNEAKQCAQDDMHRCLDILCTAATLNGLMQ